MNILEQYRQAKLIEAAQAALKHLSDQQTKHDLGNRPVPIDNKQTIDNLRKALQPFPSWNKPPDPELDSAKLKDQISKAIGITPFVKPIQPNQEP